MDKLKEKLDLFEKGYIDLLDSTISYLNNRKKSIETKEQKAIKKLKE